MFIEEFDALMSKYNVYFDVVGHADDFIITLIPFNDTHETKIVFSSNSEYLEQVTDKAYHVKVTGE